MVPVLLGDVDVPFVLRDMQAIRIESPSQVEHVAEVIRDLSEDARFDTQDLKRSAELQQAALAESRLRYEYEHSLIEGWALRASVVALLGVAAIPAIGLIVAGGRGDSAWLQAVVAPAGALLSAAIGFYFGGQSARERSRQDSERPK